MRILIVKTSSLGDIIHTFPLFAYLKKRFPDAIIDWVVERRCSELVKRHPDINRVIEVDTKKLSSWGASIKNLRKECYDLAFDVQGNSKSGLILFFVKAKEKIGFGRQSVAEMPNLLFTNRKFDPPKYQNISLDYLGIAKHYFNDTLPFKFEGICLKLLSDERVYIDQVVHLAGSLKKVIVSPGSKWKNKCLSTKQLVQYLEKFDRTFFIFTFGSNEEEKEVFFLHNHFKENSLILMKGSLAALQGLMSLSDLVISMDSLPLHLASTTNVATFSFFGASSLDKYKPLGEQHDGIQGKCPYNIQFEKRCPLLRTCVTGACIRNLKP